MSDKPRLLKGLPSLFSRGNKPQSAPASEVALTAVKTPEALDPTSPEAVHADRVETILKSHLFDFSFYAAQSKQQNLQESELVSHYLTHGAAQGFAPHPLFDTSWYLARNPDVAAAGANPLVHFILSGAREGRKPCAIFDSGWYLTNYPDVKASGMSALQHYVRYGRAEHRSISKSELRAKLESDSAMFELKRAYEVAPLPVFSAPLVMARVNVIVDSLAGDEFSLQDGQCLIVGARLAKASGVPLRVVSRKDRCAESVAGRYLVSMDIAIPSNLEFVFCDFLDPRAEIPISTRDIFVVTATNEKSVRASISNEKIHLLPAAGLDNTEAMQRFTEELIGGCKGVFV